MKVHPQAQPYSFPGKGVGCLLVHGFTGSPSEIRPLGEYLAARGIAVEAPLLAGHGTSVSDLSRTSWQDWVDSTRTGLESLRRQPVDEIYLIGLSMGGLLCLYLASMESGISGTAALNSPIWLRDPRVFFTPLLRIVNSFNPRWFAEVAKGPKGLRYKEAGERFAYDTVSPTAVAELLSFIRQVKKTLPDVTVPALVVQSCADETAVPCSAEYIYRSLGSPDKRLVWFSESSHILTLGKEAWQVFQAVEEFIAGRSDYYNKR